MEFFSRLPDWLRPQRREQEPAGEKKPASAEGRGPITGLGLSRTESLVRPIARDPFCRLRPAFSREACGLSLELAYTAYKLNLEPWMEAGWDDISIQIDNDLHTGLGSGGEKTHLQGVKTTGRLYLARAALQDRIDLRPLIADLKKEGGSDTAKAVVMLHPLEDGGYVVAIGFMGTGKRLNDWLTNLRLSTEEGFHKGFYGLCTHFEQNLGRIRFPAAAARLGLEELTLRDMIKEMRLPQSRFRLWMAGHSQGSAVMQVFAHRLITAMGVLPQNMVGYGFASPTVATGRMVYDPAGYPLFHILNREDMVTKVGAMVHLGLCLEHSVTPQFRREAYHPDAGPDASPVYGLLSRQAEEIADGASALWFGHAFCMGMRLSLEQEKEEQPERNPLAALWGQAVNYAGKTALGWMDNLLEHMEEAYLDLTGEPLPRTERHAALVEFFDSLVKKYGIRALLDAWTDLLVPPHRIVREDGEGAYSCIVKHHLDTLIPFIWVKRPDGLPVRRYGAGAMEEGEGMVPRFAPRRNAELRRAPCLMGVRRMGISARRGR